MTESLLRLCHPAGKSAPAEPGDDAAAASFRGASRRNRPGGRIWSAARLAADLERLQCELEREASTLLAQACDNEK